MSQFVIAGIAAVLVIVIIVIIASAVSKKKKKKQKSTAASVNIALPQNQDKEKQIDLSTIEFHEDTKDLIITTSNIQDYIPREDSTRSYIGTEPGMIDEYLPVNMEAKRNETSKVSTRASYDKMTPNQRGMYIKFLCDPYNVKEYESGYALIFFYSLERHLVFGEAGKATDVIENLRVHYKNQSFQTLSFNAMIFITQRNRGLTFFLKNMYYNLNVDFTIYYHLQTNKILPAEAIIRFKDNFGFANDTTSNTYAMQIELEDVLKDKFGVPGYPLDKYARSPMPKVEKLPFPANPSMDKIVTKYVESTSFYETDNFKTEICSYLNKAFFGTRR